MTAPAGVSVARADVVGSLQRPGYLRDGRRGVRQGILTLSELRAIEDQAVREAIALQEHAGLDVITDGEFRRQSWIATIPLLDERDYRAPLGGFSFIRAEPGWLALWKDRGGHPAQLSIPTRAFITEPLRVERDIVADEYPFLKANARVRTKYSIPAPSWHRVNWHPHYSRDAYATADDFLRAIARYLREHVVEPLIALGCDYVQLDAPNYAQWHVDAGNRAAFAAAGHDMAAELEADAEIDNSVFKGITGITRAMHICRGNGPAGLWLAKGGYDSIASTVFPRLSNIDRLLLEYDTPRAGDFGPLQHVRPEAMVVLGLITTKDAAIEDAAAVESRIREASCFVPLERLALSPQCGFSSGEVPGYPVTLEAQQEKLRLIGRIARTVWG
jgi:5-methyltetrahydropteroyltriglutamate--homocysteine methyltransferase